MKVRIKGNSAWFGLTKTEVDIFCKEGEYIEPLNLIQKFSYALKVKTEITSLEADL